MTSLLHRTSPGITKLIRMDHSQVFAIFRKFDAQLRPAMKRALVDRACLALEVHAQLEEEIFYPALRSASSEDTVLAKSVPEHNEMRRVIGKLRGLEPGNPSYDSTFMELMREVMHHVADEETVLLPAAERLLAGRLRDLGTQMSRRRMQLLRPHAGEIVVNTARTVPKGRVLVAAGGLLAGGYLVRLALQRRLRLVWGG